MKIYDDYCIELVKNCLRLRIKDLFLLLLFLMLEILVRGIV